VVYEKKRIPKIESLTIPQTLSLYLLVIEATVFSE